MTDYKEIKKGIKQAELDKTVYGVQTFFCILFGVVVGFVSHSWFIGVIAWLIPGTFFAMKHYELIKK